MRTGVLADVGVREVVRNSVVLTVVLCTSNKEWVSIRRAWAHGCVGRTLSFSGDTGAPKKYCKFCNTSSFDGAKVRGCG